MPNVQDLKSSKFLTKNDVEPDKLVTIASFDELNVAMESMAPELKWCLYFKELDKPMVLNMTNGQLIEAITGEGDFNHWVGKVVVLYNDKTVSFGGKLTGGIRVRAPRNQAAPPDMPRIPEEERAKEKEDWDKLDAPPEEVAPF